MNINPSLQEAAEFFNQGRYEDARGIYRMWLRARPDSFEALFALGVIHQREGDYAEAEAYYRRALALQPNHVDACNNLGWVLRKQGKWGDALLAFRAAISLNPGFAGAHANLGLVLLQLGDFEQGWREYEYRLEDEPALRPDLPFEHWQGQAPRGKRFLLIGEQGLGDCLQFLRYVTVLAEEGAAVDVLVAPALTRIAQSVPGVRSAFAHLQTTSDAYDYQCQLLSLPFWMGTRAHNIPARVPYLSVGAERIERWRKNVAAPAGHLRVGLVWSGGQRPEDEAATVFDQRRSLTFADYAPLLEVPKTRFFSLQLGAPAQQLKAAGELGARVVDLGADLHDFVDTAAVVMNLDLVITCDTSVAHLAGALNRPVWIINRYDRCWRWLTDREDSPWYPSARLFTQARPGDWAELMMRVRQALEKRSAPYPAL